MTGAATWTAGGSAAFHPVIQGRNPGDGGTLRSLSSQLSYPVPPGAHPLGFREPDLQIFQTHAWLEIGGDRNLSISEITAWHDLGGGARLTSGRVALFLEQGGGKSLTATQSDLDIELDLS